MSLIGVLGILLSITVLIVLSYRGLNSFIASLVAATVAIVTNGMPFWETISSRYAASMKGFIGGYFLLFVLGAIYGEIMKRSGAAESIAHKMILWFGAKYALLATIVVTAVMSYGGISVFVIIFAIYPLAMQLFKEANISKDLMPAVILFAAVTCMLPTPGSPTLTNAIPTKTLGTTIYAAPMIGFLSLGVMFVLGYMYLNLTANSLAASGEGYSGDEEIELKNESQLPNFALSVAPIIVVMLVVFFTKDMMSAINSINTALLLAIACSLFSNMTFVKEHFNEVISSGVSSSFAPLMVTAGIIGFGGVVQGTPAFQSFVEFSVGVSELMNPYLSGAVAVNVVSGITGSALGGMQIFSNTMIDTYTGMAINPAAFHRVIAIAAGGLDTLPHCSVVITMFLVIGVEHKKAYKHVFAVSVLLPLIGTLVAIGGALIGLT